MGPPGHSAPEGKDPREPTTMETWLAEVDPHFGPTFHAKMQQEGYTTLFALRYEYEDLLEAPFRLKKGYARMLWAATLAVRAELGYPWEDPDAAGEPVVTATVAPTMEFPVLRRCDGLGRSGAGSHTLLTSGIGGLPTVKVCAAWHTRVVQWCRGATNTAFAATAKPAKELA